MIKKLLILFSIAFIQTSKAQPAFTRKTDFIEQRHRAFSFILNNKFYTGTGWNENSIMNNQMYQFDIATNTWSQLNDFPTQPVRNGISMVINDTAYAGFAWDGTNSIGWYQYNASTDSWTLKNSICNAGQYSGTFSLNGKGYVACGSAIAGEQNELWEYDPSLDLWNQKTSFPGAARDFPFADTVNGYAYVGLGDFFFAYPFYSDMYKYDAVNDTWSAIAPIPNSSTGAVAKGGCSFHASWNGKIILMSINGIRTSNLADYNTVYVYDPANDSWTLYENTNPIGARATPLFAQNGSKAYYGAGDDFVTGIYKDFLEVDLNIIMNSVENANPYLKNITITSASNHIFVNIPKELFRKKSIEIDLYSIDGKKLETFSLTGNDCLTINNFTKGPFVYILRSDKSTLKSGKVVLY